LKNNKKFQKPSSLKKLSVKNENNQVSLITRIFGSKKELENARENFFKKYSFETNINPLRIITFLLFLSFILCIFIFLVERNNENTYREWVYDGIESIPPLDTLNFESVIEFSKNENFLTCNSKDPIKLLEGICDQSLFYINEMNSTQSNSQIIFIIQFIILFLLFFPLGTFFHRAIRNIKTLKYQTNISAEKSIIWIYFGIFLYFLFTFISRWLTSNDTIIFIIIFLPSSFLSFRIYRVLKEIYLGSSILEISNKSLLSIFSNKLKIWFLIFFSCCMFNPSTITRLWGYNAQNLSEFIDVTRLMYISSALLGILCVVTLLLVVEIYKMQEIKKIKKGSIEIDPLNDD